MQYKVFARMCSAHTEVGVILPPCQLAFVLTKIVCFAMACGYMASIGYFWKI
jgi:hypothetical protein